MKNAPTTQPGDRFLCKHAVLVCEVYLVSPHGYHYTMGGSKYFSPSLMPEGLENADWNEFFETVPIDLTNEQLDAVAEHLRATGQAKE